MMSSAVVGPVVVASKWEPHKQKIKRLFIDENKTLQEVKSGLEIEDGFIASKREYERQLKIWDFSKNMKNKHLKVIKLKLEARQKQKAESDVYLRGVKLPKLEIQRKAQQCFVSTTDRMELQKCSTPTDLLIITPTSNSYMAYVKSKDLPWIFFQRYVDSIGSLSIVINMPKDMLEIMLPKSCPNPSPLIDNHLNRMIHYLSQVMPVHQDKIVMEFLQKIFGGGGHSTYDFLKLAVYLLSNKLLDHSSMNYFENPSSDFCDQLLRWFQMQQNHLFVRELLSTSSPTIEAFAEVIFGIALLDQNERFLRILFEAGMNPEATIFDEKDQSRYRPLQFLARRGDLHLMKIFVDNGADLHANIPDGDPFGTRHQSPLQLAARRGDLEIVKFLIHRGANVNLPEEYGESALQNAALAGSIEVVSLLIDNGAQLDVAYSEYGCALSCAILAEASSVVHLLLRLGADVNCQPGSSESAGDTPLQSASRVGDFPTVKRLLELNADVNAPACPYTFHGSDDDIGGTALQLAAEEGNLDISLPLLQAGADVQPHKPRGSHRLLTSPLMYAVQSKSHELVKLLISHGADVNYQWTPDQCVNEWPRPALDEYPRTALEMAASLGDQKFVFLLLSAGADPSQDQYITYAIRADSSELADLLLNTGADIRKHGAGLLCAAVATQDLRIVKYWIDRGACVVNQDINSFSPILEAVTLNNIPMIEAILVAGADIDSYGRYEYTDADGAGVYAHLNALQVACCLGDIKLVLYLIRRGANINWGPTKAGGRTALQAAAEIGDLELVKLLIDYGADVNPLHGGGYDDTVLQLAIKTEKWNIVDFLLQAGAHVEDPVSGSLGMTSLQLAARAGNNDLVQVLIDRGAKVSRRTPYYCGEEMTALEAAVEAGHCQTVRLLLSLNAEANTPGPLISAVRKGHVAIVEALLEAGAVVDAVYTDISLGQPKTALEAAASNGRIDMMKLLLENGADITKTEKGRLQLANSLHFAKESGHYAAAKFLKYHQIA